MCVYVCVCVCVCACIYICVCIYLYMSVCVYTYIHIHYIHTHTHTHIHTYTYTHIHTHIHTYIHTYIHTHTHTYIHTYKHTYMDVSVAEWLAWLTSNCGQIGAIGSSPSNGLKPNLWGQKGFNPLCQCVYVYVCIVNPDIQTIHRCTHTSIHTHTHTYTHIHTYILLPLSWTPLRPSVCFRGLSGLLRFQEIAFSRLKRFPIDNFRKWKCVTIFKNKQ